MKTEFIAYAIQNKENKKFLDNIDLIYDVALKDAMIFRYKTDAVYNIKKIGEDDVFCRHLRKVYKAIKIKVSYEIESKVSK